MTKNQTLLAQAVILILCVGYSFYISGRLPDTVPTHWNIDGKVDGYGPKVVTLWMMPGMILLIALLTVALPALSPKKFEIDRFASTFGTAMFIISLLMAALHYVIIDATLHAATGAAFDIGKVMMVVIFLFFAVLGNLMGRVKQNFFIGIRTPWTLSDERVWDKTHREAGILWLIGGLFGAGLCALGLSMYFTLPLLLVISLIPVVRSYMIYKQLNPDGNSNASA